MNRRITIAVSAAIAAGAAPASIALGADHRAATTAGVSTAAVTVRIEGQSKTLLDPTSATGEKGSITVGGTPAGKCPGSSAAGALDRATRHRWTGKYYASVGGIFVSSILGEMPSGNDYWTIFVDNKSSSAGLCSIKLRKGEQLLFAVTDGKEYPAALTAPQTAKVGKSFKVKLVGYSAKGASKPLAGVTITGKGIKAVKTNGQGTATITDTHKGVLVLRSAPKGEIRTESIVHLTP
jgi:hypothetical protein